MFSKIYKAAVDDLTPNENLKQKLLLEAEKCTKEKHVIRPLYRHLSAAAAVIVLAVSLRSAPDIVKMINPSKSENSVIQKAANTEMDNDTFAESENIQHDTAAVPVETQNPTVMPTKTPEVSKQSNDSAKVKKTKRTESKAVVAEDTVQNKIRESNIVSKPETDEKKVPVPSNEPEPTAEVEMQTVSEAAAVVWAEDTAETEAASIDSEENQPVAASLDDIQTAAAYNGEAEMARTGGGGGGSASGSSFKISSDVRKELWSVKEYSEYTGLDVQSKINIPEGFCDKTEPEKYFELDADSKPLNDEWIYHYTNGDKYISIITSKKKAEYSGEALNLHGIQVYTDENVYSFSYNGVSLNVLYSDVEEEVVIEVIKSLIN